MDIHASDTTGSELCPTGTGTGTASHAGANLNGTTGNDVICDVLAASPLAPPLMTLYTDITSRRDEFSII